MIMIIKYKTYVNNNIYVIILPFLKVDLLVMLISSCYTVLLWRFLNLVKCFKTNIIGEQQNILRLKVET